MKDKHALIVPDTHIPYHDKKAFRLMLKATKAEYPNLDEIVLLGDFGEYATVSSHPKDPKLKRLLKTEIAQVNSVLDTLDKTFPKANKVYIEGNHEDRLTRFIRDEAPVLADLVSSRSLLLGNRVRWDWIPYGPTQRYNVLGSKLIARHEPLGGGEHVAASTVKKAGASVIFGHVHRIQEFQTVDINGQNHRGITPGWLGDHTNPIFDYVQNHHQWALGFSIVSVQPTGLWFHNTIHIIDYKCLVNGTIYEV